MILLEIFLEDTMLITENLHVAYKGAPQPALQKLNIQIEGSACIMGPSGAGKSTLLKTLLGLIRPQGGRIILDGEVVSGQPLVAKRLMAYMPQENALPRESTLQEYVEAAAALDGVSRSARAARTLWALGQVRLEEHARQRLKWLSGGMKRRALLAGALLRDTPYLLLDEPTRGLDPGEQAEIRALVRRLSQDRRVILTTQVVEDASALRDHLIVLRAGQKLMDTRYAYLEQVAQGHVFREAWTDYFNRPDGPLWAPDIPGESVRVYRNTPNGGVLVEDTTAEDGYLWLLSSLGDSAV